MPDECITTDRIKSQQSEIGNSFYFSHWNEYLKIFNNYIHININLINLFII